jgi:hypothetical protein
VSVPRHTYDRAYVEIPDVPQASMLDVDALPENVRAALSVCREFELDAAGRPGLLADPVRAWFRHEWRAREETGDGDRS